MIFSDDKPGRIHRDVDFWTTTLLQLLFLESTLRVAVMAHSPWCFRHIITRTGKFQGFVSKDESV